MQDESLLLVIGVQSSSARIVEYGAPSYDEGLLANPLQVYPASNIASPKSLLVVSKLCFSALQLVPVLAHASWQVLPVSPNTQLPVVSANYIKSGLFETKFAIEF